MLTFPPKNKLSIFVTRPGIVNWPQFQFIVYINTNILNILSVSVVQYQIYCEIVTCIAFDTSWSVHMFFYVLRAQRRWTIMAFHNFFFLSIIWKFTITLCFRSAIHSSLSLIHTIVPESDTFSKYTFLIMCLRKFSCHVSDFMYKWLSSAHSLLTC